MFEAQFTFYPAALGECHCRTWLNQPGPAAEACEAASALLEEAVVEMPEDPRVHSALGLSYALLGRKDEAIREGELAVALWPISKAALKGPQFVKNLAMIYQLYRIFRVDPNWKAFDLLEAKVAERKQMIDDLYPDGKPVPIRGLVRPFIGAPKEQVVANGRHIGAPLTWDFAFLRENV